MKKLIIILGIVFSLAINVKADTGISSQFFTYNFHLYYDNGKLATDRNFKFPYDLIAEEFIPVKINIANPYKGEVANTENKILSTFQFDPQSGDPKFTKGKLSVKAPYFADAKEVSFYDSKGSKLLTISVSGSSFCNDDGKCNTDVGEDHNTCPNDCKVVVTPVPSISPSNSPPAETPGTVLGISRSLLIYSGLGLAVIILIWLIWKWWRKRRSSNIIG